MQDFLRLFAFSASVAFPIAAGAAATAPAGSTEEQQALVLDWAKYTTACRGGAVDGTLETAWGYCGTAEYILFKLGQQGICAGEGKGEFMKCSRGPQDPLKDYPF